MSVRITFIINPIAGDGKSATVKQLAEKLLDKTRFTSSFFLTTHAGEAREKAMELAETGSADVVVAVGGDGTVNEVASALVQAEANIQGTDNPICDDSIPALTIIPTGSGNGLARHLGISLDPEEAVVALNRASFGKIDSGILNGRRFFCTCGVGIDADVAHKFAALPTRGLWTYVKAGIMIWFSFEPGDYSICCVRDGKQTVIERKAMLLTAGNANQWGNGAYITAGADACDGLLDLTIIAPIHLWNVPRILRQLMAGRIYESRFVEHIRCSSIDISRPGEAAAHFDGEPVILGKDVQIRILPSSLRIFA